MVVPSAIENHSSTLREAMAVGVSSIASYVGGIPEQLSTAKTDSFSATKNIFSLPILFSEFLTMMKRQKLSAKTEKTTSDRILT